MGSSTCYDHASWWPPQPHVVLFPFMSKGHTIPLLHLARLLLRRGVAVTVITTPSNRPFIAQSLQPSAASIIDLPFPFPDDGDIPAGVESVDKLPSISLFFDFVLATQLMQPHLERLLHTLTPRVTFLVSDGFLWWTLDSASKFGIPRFVFFGMSNYIHVVIKEVLNNNGPPQTHDDESILSLTHFPWIRLSKDELECLILRSHTKSSIEFRERVGSATENSYGMIVNSFYELESAFIDYWNITTESSPKSWCIGPLCLGQKLVHSKSKEASNWIQWLDKKLEEKCSVLYVAFGSQAEVSAEQVREIASGLEESKVNFLWVVRKKKNDEWEEGFEERVKERGMIVREWVDQREILMHESVEGFLSHCGWNSVLESVCAGVPILGFPLMAEQPLNARMVEEELKVGLRVGVKEGLVRKEELEKKVRELMEGEKGKEARKEVKELAEMAEEAVEEGGSSWRTLETLIHETSGKEWIPPLQDASDCPAFVGMNL